MLYLSPLIPHLFALSLPSSEPLSLSRCLGGRGNCFDSVQGTEEWKWAGSHRAFSLGIVAAWNRIINAILSCICRKAYAQPSATKERGRNWSEGFPVHSKDYIGQMRISSTNSIYFFFYFWSNWLEVLIMLSVCFALQGYARYPVDEFRSCQADGGTESVHVLGRI